jgi:hypothetical protein
MRLSMTLLLCSVPFLAQPAMADMYRCPAKDGSMAYSDTPCSPNAERMEAPQPTRITPTTTPAPSAAPDAPLQARLDRQRRAVEAKGLGIRQRETVQCESREYNAWIRMQNPLPDQNTRLARLSSIQDECRKIHHFTDADAAAYSAPAGR